jgi:hypothetical protein
MNTERMLAQKLLIASQQQTKDDVRLLCIGFSTPEQETVLLRFNSIQWLFLHSPPWTDDTGHKSVIFIGWCSAFVASSLTTSETS